jgi:FKBP-type peptidyl-prolyl cis-trans isomerase FklB
MKKIGVLALLFCNFYSGYGQKSKPATNPAASATSSLKTKEDSVQYALGIYIAKWLMGNGFTNLDLTRITSGIADIYSNKPRLVKDENAERMITVYQMGLQRDLAKKLENQLFTSIKDKEGVGKLPSGVQFAVQKQGKGKRASETDSITINFKGSLANGVVFDDTYQRKESVVTTPKDLIPGLAEALQLMPEGAVWELYIPSSQAYGEKGNGTNIPPNSALVMIVELLAVKRNG